jgi:hypothetical protein
MQLNINKGEKKRTPHLAVCHSENPSANNRHVSLLMKSSDVELTEEIIKAVEKFGVANFPEHIQKAMSMRNSKMLLENALKEAYCDKDEWLCVEDWKDNKVYFSTGDYDSWEMLATDFTMTEDGVVTVGDTASPVVQISDYMVVDGKVKLSETAEDMLESGMYEIVSKAIVTGKAQSLLTKSIKEFQESLEKATSIAVSDDINVNKTKTMEKPLDIQEIMKSAEFQELIKAQLEAAQAPLKEELAKAKAKEAEAEEILKAAIQVEQNQTVEFVKSANFIAEDKQDAMVAFLMKSRKTEDHALVMDIIKAAQEAIVKAQEEVTKTKDQFALSEVGKDGKVEVAQIKPEEFIKAKADSLFPAAK